MTVKSLDEIWQDYLDHDHLPIQTRKDLKWWLTQSDDPAGAILMITDMDLSISDIKEFIPLMAAHLENKDDYIREVTVGCLVGRLFQHQYAGKALDMAKNDQYSNVRSLAISSLGAIIDKVDKKLQKEIANYIYKVLTNIDYDSLFKECAYHSVVVAMYVPPLEWPRLKLEPDIEKMINKELLARFCEKYGISQKQ